MQDDEHHRFASRSLISSWDPQADPESPKAQKFRTWSSRRDVTLTFCGVISVAVLIVNVTTTIVFRIKYEANGNLGTRTIYRGNCDTAGKLGSYLHLAINVLSTILFGASNFCMQLLASPTRDEVDEAHKHHRWLDIGVPSVRNLKSISPRRRVLWVLLGLSSLPLHFLFVVKSHIKTMEERLMPSVIIPPLFQRLLPTCMPGL